MSEKNPNNDYGKSQEKSVSYEHPDHPSHQEYQKLLEKIDNCLEKMDDMKKDPQEDHENFDTPTKLPSYFTELVSIFYFFNRGNSNTPNRVINSLGFCKIDSDL